MLWERKLSLEREMQEALDPSVGTDVVGAMKKEIHRMQMRHAELLRLQVGGGSMCWWWDAWRQWLHGRVVADYVDASAYHADEARRAAEAAVGGGCRRRRFTACDGDKNDSG